MSMISVLKTGEDFDTDPKKAEELVRKLLLPFGGAEFFFCPGERVVFLADAALPADNETGANFDIRLLWALTHAALAQGMMEVTVCLKPAEGFSWEQIKANTSYGKLAALDGVKIVPLDTAAATDHATDTALAREKMRIYDTLYAADVIISLAKFKVADDRLFGGALANMAYAADMDEHLPDEQVRQRALVDIYSTVSPDLVIVDCIKGQGGFQNNKASCVMAGSDVVALDTVLCAMADLPLAANEGLMLASQYGMGVSNPAEITIVGDDLREIMADTAADRERAKRLN